MTFSDMLRAFGDALRARNPLAIAGLVIVCLLLFALIFGPGALLNFLHILMPFWIPLVIYALSYWTAKEYQTRHPDFIDANIVAIAVTAAVIILYLVMR